MDTFIEVVRAQYNAALDMLEDLIDRCSNEVWEEQFNGSEFGRECDHCLYWLELLTDRWKPFDNDRECLREYPTRIDIKYYLTTTRGINNGYLKGSLQELAALDYNGSVEEAMKRLIETLRHAQHHIGKLTGYLQTKKFRVERWE